MTSRMVLPGTPPTPTLPRKGEGSQDQALPPCGGGLGGGSGPAKQTGPLRRGSDPEGFELVSGDTVMVQVPPRVTSGSAPASGSVEASCADVEVVSGSGVQILVGDVGRDDGPVAPLVREMIDAWRQGDCPAVEDLLARHPELRDDAWAVARLISEEIRLRREYGREILTSEFVRRFPRWESRVVELIDLMTPMPATAAFPSSPLPATGEALGEFRLLSVLGRGVRGERLPGGPAEPGQPAGGAEDHAPQGARAPVAGAAAACPHRAALLGAGPRRPRPAGALHALPRRGDAGAAAVHGGRDPAGAADRPRPARRAGPGPGRGRDRLARAGAPPVGSWRRPPTSRRCAGSGRAWPMPCTSPTGASCSTWT